MNIDALDMHFQVLNEKIREDAGTTIRLQNVNGQRYIGCGTSGKNIEIYGTPGNALGAYLNGGRIEVFANAQDASGDTMNAGTLIIHGSCGDTAGYAMRNGKIFIKGSAGCRVGIHMKAYQQLHPVIVIGKSAGDFLGEYQAGGTIVVLGIGCDDAVPVGSFCGTGMHGGAIYIRATCPPKNLPPQVLAKKATLEDMEEIRDYVEEFCGYFGENSEKLLKGSFYKLTPNTANPYHQLYVNN